ncbi:M20 family metallopeptidase [Lutimaribacter sp. EGI FJ00015]|uniref:M20 family metallopeptidase n=1 Tax=Lutimaribacter degradans TaxID=2945989 RepID=A0ACC5ZS21_9RHOB|nr:M20 aminoacylase family protein [Lutimaribacter sp. EGI FJ00013]MCM2560836.1 M20 family metallopeptidase [Lutimaribacter sp. EGI FJ00013]MCO0612219.1 M20 family metallopeptidase [Lutimaribacter sp. EGI FJ00015]MCO0634661.1 M20 family metallopeptidase [Lutimaribacter sp. EGI FJ00014]
MPVRNRLAEMHEEITAWRRDFHAHPEIMFDLPRTAGVVAEKLRAFGCDEVVEGIGRTGVVGVIHGKSTRSGKVIGLRADMDALPMDEITGLPYTSETPGAMHACGHDGHTAMLLGAAQYLAETRNFDGTVVVIFQPAEEGGGGGLEMVKDGLMDRWGIQEVYGLHNMPGTPVGHFAIRPGPQMASADEFIVEVEGRGGHAAVPHQAIDCVLVGSQIVLALNGIVSRNVDPVKNAVLTVATFLTESDTQNIISHTVKLRGTVRCFDADVRDLVEERLKALATGIAASHGAVARVTYNRGYPPTVNHEDQAEFAADCAEAVAGAANVDRNTPPVMPAEDFAYMLEARPGAYIFLGNGDTAMCHHPAYDFDDASIPLGCSWFAELVERRMPVE